MERIIDILKIEVGSEPNTKHIRIDFRYNGEHPKKVVVKFYETFFKLGYRAVGGVIELSQGLNYWVSDSFGEGLVYRFNNKIKICFDDVDNDNTTIYEEIINIGNTNLQRRSMGREMSIQNVWFLSDSNGYHYFSKYRYNSDEYFFNDKVLMSIDVPELSVNRFVNSNYIDFFETLPLFKGDIIILNLGEIDCRVAFYRNAKNKNRSLIEQINNISDRYIESIKKLINHFENIEFIVCLPHPPLRDGWVKEYDNNHLLNESTEKDRMFIREYFIRYITQKLNDLNVRYLNPFVGLEDEQGFIYGEYLLPFDNHTRDNEIVLNELKCLI
jgi:hypothetical protein